MFPGKAGAKATVPPPGSQHALCVVAALEMSGRTFPNVLFVLCGRRPRFGDSVRVLCQVTGISSLAAKTNPREDS